MYLSDSPPNKISKKEFLNACDKFPANAWTKFAFRYFSQDTVKKDKWPSRIFSYTGILLFLLGFLGTALTWSHSTIGIIIFLFSTLLVCMGIFKGGAALMNNFRIKRIRKTLGITKEEYSGLVSAYFD